MNMANESTRETLQAVSSWWCGLEGWRLNLMGRFKMMDTSEINKEQCRQVDDRCFPLCISPITPPEQSVQWENTTRHSLCRKQAKDCVAGGLFSLFQFWWCVMIQCNIKATKTVSESTWFYHLWKQLTEYPFSYVLYVHKKSLSD